MNPLKFTEKAGIY